MKLKKHITKKAVRAYLQEQNLEEEKLFSMHRLTQEGETQLHQIIKHFTGAMLVGKTVAIEMEMGISIKSGDFDTSLFNRERTDSIDVLLGSINEIIDFRNFASRKINEVTPSIDALSKEDKKEHDVIMKKAQTVIDQLNSIGDTRLLHITDLQNDIISPLLEARKRSRELQSKAKERQDELHTAKPKQHGSEQER